MTRQELIKKLRALAKNNQDLSNDTELLAECRKLGLTDFDTTKPGKIADFLENSPVVEEKSEEEMGTRALNSQDLKVILAEYEKHKSSGDATRIAQEVQDNPLLKKADAKDILRVIERKIKLDSEIRENENKKTAQKENPEPALAKKTEVNEEANRRIVVEEEIKRSAAVKREEVELIAKKVVETAGESKSLEESRKRAADVIKEAGIKDKDLRKQVTEITVEQSAEVIVKERTDEVVSNLTSELESFDLTTEQKNKIEEVVRERVEAVVDDPTKKINEHQAVVAEKGGKKTIETGKSLTEEVAEVLENNASSNERTQIETSVKKAEVKLEETIFTNETNGNSPVDIVRGKKLEEEVVSRMMERGSGIEEAKEVATMVRELSFPVNETSNSAATVVAMETLENNGYHSGENSRFAEQAGVLRNLIRSPIKVGQNVKKILDAGKKLDGVKGFDQLKNVAKVLKDNPRLMQTMEFMQRLSRLQGAVNNLIGGFSNPIGYIFKIPAVQEFTVQLATRFGGEMVGAMASQIANFGFETGLKNIAGQLLAKGTVTAVQAGATAAAEGAATVAGTVAVDATVDAGLAATGVGAPVALIMMAVQLGIGILKKVGKSLEGLMDKIGIGSAKTKAWMQDSFGKLGGGLLYWGGMGAMLLLALPAALGAFSVGIAGALVPITLGGIAFMQGSTAQTVSSLVAPRGMGGNCVKIGTNPGGGSINCDQNAPENSVAGADKANFVRVANGWLPGTNYSSQCFNDTVNRALCSGINPVYALSAWLHESAASNYTGRSDIEDFGMHSIPQNEDFNAQITAFLKLDPATGCINDPRIGGDYWLAFSANYLNGSNCDPDHPNSITKMTPRQYEAEWKQTWGMVTNSLNPTLPNGIHVPVAGKNCDQIGKSTSDSGGGSYTYTDKNGDKWQCTNPLADEGASQVPADPIYDDTCTESPAYCVVKYLLGNGVDSVRQANVEAVAKLINKWQNAPASFNKANFNSAMIASATTVGPEYVFQCVGFAVAVNPKIGSTSWGGDTTTWDAMIAHGSSECPRIVNSGAGVGDFILFPTGSWYHIQVLSQLRSDGSYTISQANWGGPGKLSNVEGSDIQSYLSGKSVLRCK
jgi:hypothetical protein